MTRQCGDCSACCRWPAIAEIDKPARTPCQFLGKSGHGCTIYADRPSACSAYQCSWLRGVGGEEDQPFACGVMIDRRMTQFGHLLVAKQLKPGAAMKPRGIAAIRRATHDDDGLPCLVLDYEDTERVIGVAGPADLRKEVESKKVDGVIRVGDSGDFVNNLVTAAQEGRVMPGVLNNGR